MTLTLEHGWVIISPPPPPPPPPPQSNADFCIRSSFSMQQFNYCMKFVAFRSLQQDDKKNGANGIGLVIPTQGTTIILLDNR